MIDIIIQLLITGILLGGIYALVSIGLCLIYGVLEIVNFAHGEFLMLSMYMTYWLFNTIGADPYISILIILPIFFIFGAAIERIIIKPLINADHLNQIFATVGLSMVFQNLALLLWRADYRTITTAYSSKSMIVGNFMISFPRFIAFLIAIGIIVILFVFLKITYTGKAIRAVSQERRAASLMGINVDRTYQIAFGIGIAITGIGGAILMPIYYAFPTVGNLFSLIAFVVVVLGGYNNLIGALAGGFIIGIVETFSGFYITPHLKEAIYFALFIMILLFRPTGLLGRKENA
jgi:branched-chain amino acid transport system permease protein